MTKLLLTAFLIKLMRVMSDFLQSWLDRAGTLVNELYRLQLQYCPPLWLPNILLLNSLPNFSLECWIQMQFVSSWSLAPVPPVSALWLISTTRSRPRLNLFSASDVTCQYLNSDLSENAKNKREIFARRAMVDKAHECLCYQRKT